MNDIVKRENQVRDALELEGIRNQLESLLANNPREMEKFKARMIAVSTTYGLKDCTPESIIVCGVKALALDLPLEAGQGYIVNYAGHAQFDIGYKGWQILAKRSGISVLADPVYKCDHFEQTGYGFDVDFALKPNHSERHQADDAWVGENILGVIVSMKENASGQVVKRYVEQDMLLKIVGISPSTKTEKALKYSPHANWKSQMLCAKAIKQVISKMPIEVSQDSKLHEAIEVVNQTEAAAQQQPVSMPEYSQERFDELWPAWVNAVENGKKTGNQIMTHMSNSFKLTGEQLQRLGELRNHEPIEGETVVDEQEEG